MTIMRLPDWQRLMKRRTDRLRDELYNAIGELEVFTAALRTEIDRDDEGVRGDQRGPTDQPSH